MIFNVPAHVDPNMTTACHGPFHDFDNLIKGASVHAVTGTFGNVWQQREPGRLNLFTKHCFGLTKPVSLELYAEGPMILLSYTLKGDLKMRHDRLGEMVHASYRYFMYYLPQGEHLFYAGIGNCTILKMQLDLHLVTSLSYKYPILSELCKRAGEGCPNGFCMSAIPMRKDVSKVINAISKNVHEDKERELFVDEQASRLVLQYTKTLKKGSKKKEQNKYRLSDDELEAIRQTGKAFRKGVNLRKKVADLAKDCKMSYRKFTNGFHSEHGKSPTQIQAEELSNKICYQLLNTNKTIEEIAFDLEFENGALLARFFKKQLNCTPTEYRKMFRKKENKDDAA